MNRGSYKKHKNIWDCHLTIHGSISEKDNFVFFTLAKDEEMAKMKLILKLAKEHPQYKERVEQFEKVGRFS